jgi:ubiquitin-conjugating enzyme E2 variant
MLVGPFRRHHRDPLAITRISVVENLGASAIAGPVALALARPSWGDHAFGWHLWVWFLAFAVVSNLFHRWAHWPRARKPRWMAALQRYRLLLPAREHLRHHRAPHRVNYCILSGWANALTNRVAWHRLEALLLRVGVGTHFD